MFAGVEFGAEAHRAAVVRVRRAGHADLVAVIDQRHSALGEREGKCQRESLVGFIAVGPQRGIVVSEFAGVADQLARGLGQEALDIVVAEEGRHRKLPIRPLAALHGGLEVAHGSAVVREGSADGPEHREIKLRVQGVGADVAAHKVVAVAAGEGLADGVRPRVAGLPGVESRAQVACGEEVHVLDGVHAKPVRAGLVEPPHGVIQHLVGDSHVGPVDVRQIAGEPTVQCSRVPAAARPSAHAAPVAIKPPVPWVVHEVRMLAVELVVHHVVEHANAMSVRLFVERPKFVE